jgi:hypothetical protein
LVISRSAIRHDKSGFLDYGGAGCKFIVHFQEAAEKLAKAAKSLPQALKRSTFSMTYGTTDSRALPKNLRESGFFRSLLDVALHDSFVRGDPTNPSCRQE